MEGQSCSVLIRADGSGQIGMGHIMRCIGLAQELRRRGHKIIFALARDNDAVVGRLQYEQFEYLCFDTEPASDVDGEQTVATCTRLGISTVVVDGYQFDGDWLAGLKAASLGVMLWTDYPQSGRLPVDIILDQTPQPDIIAYRAACPDGEILAGLDYAVLRSEFLQRKNFRRLRKGVNNLLVTMGGSDPGHTTLKVLNALKNVDYSFTVNVVVGPANTSAGEISELAAQLNDCHVYNAVRDMSELIEKADLAISAAGTTLWEFAYSGLPTIAISIADNQDPLAAGVANFGGGLNLGKASMLKQDEIVRALVSLPGDQASLQEMSQNMMARVDGKGVQRVASRIEALFVRSGSI